MNFLTKEYNSVLSSPLYAGWNKNDLLMYRILFFLPLLNAAADSTIYYFVDINSSGLHPGIIRGLLLLAFILFFGLKRIQKFTVNIHILLFLGFLFLTTLFSSNLSYSISTGYIKWFVGLLMFPIGMYFFRTYESIIKLIFFLVLGASMVCLNLLIAQFTGFGISAYVDDTFYIGGAGVGITNQLAFVLLTYPVILRMRNNFTSTQKWFIYIVGILSIAFVVLAMKRAGLIGLAGGGLIYFGFTRKKREILKVAILSSLVFLMILPVFKDILVNRYTERAEQTKEFEKEGRYKEFFYVIEEFKETPLIHKLFGNETFNTGQFFGMKYFHRTRMIHGDFSAFFYGAGLVGIGMYLSLFIMILNYGIMYLKRYSNIVNIREMLASFFSLLFATFLVSATGSGTIGERCLVYLYMGAVVGVCSRLHLVLNNKKG